MGVYITGDCHGNWGKVVYFSTENELTKEDFVIVCGDFGIWNGGKKEDAMLDRLSELESTTLFVSGNHENFDRLYSEEFETIDFCGGKAQKIRENVLHLKRGYVFNLCGKKFFAFGGASSHDIADGILDPKKFNSIDEFYETHYQWMKMGLMFRVKGYSWWERELPTHEEMQRGIDILKENNNKVDFIISHCCPQQIASIFSSGLYKSDILTNYFDEVAVCNHFEKWYFGHYHDDRTIMGKYVMLYDTFERVI